jgi:hypothetical protein
MSLGIRAMMRSSTRVKNSFVRKNWSSLSLNLLRCAHRTRPQQREREKIDRVVRWTCSSDSVNGIDLSFFLLMMILVLVRARTCAW